MATPPQQSSFPPTEWTRILLPLKQGTPGAGEALERLCEIYRPPIFDFFRRHGIDEHRAEDMTQDFILSLLRNEIWQKVDRSGGLFRCFLVTRLRWFLLNHHTRSAPAGLPLEDIPDGVAEQHLDPSSEFDRAWARALVQEALRRLERRWSLRSGRIPFGELSGFLTTAADDPRISSIAARHGLTLNAAYQVVHRLKQYYLETITQCVQETVSERDRLRDELNYLLRCLS